FVFFGSEELGLLGSLEYIRSLTEPERNSILTMFNFDALGTSSASGILASDELAASVELLAKARNIELKRHFDLGNSSSDHSPFAEASIPFIFFLGDDFSRIHTIDDTMDFVTPGLLGNAAILAIALLEELPSTE
ncbi:MAG: M28 family peptidase, partial [Chloroflexi bacterium]|nr:M28 family peptidase [Chloroflexota bacterium]